MAYQPPIPPAIKRTLPTDPFENWLARQALAGHDRQWLQRHKVGLRKRWQENEQDLPPPERREKPIDRYGGFD